ncbi:MAG: glycosyltransferase family protein [Longimicrobiales bacterium]
MVTQFPYLFNFARSVRGGGFKRLFEYAKWFDRNGGAYFAVNVLSQERLANSFPRNRYFPVDQPLRRRIYDDWGYLREITKEMGRPEFYYAYGIPVYKRLGRVNWFHLSNVLPVHSLRGIPVGTMDRAKARYLGWKIRRHFRDADIISAESRWSLGLIGGEDPKKLFLSVNGSDDELKYLSRGRSLQRKDTAIVVGTRPYKSLGDSLRVFDMLRAVRSGLTLLVFGEEEYVPLKLRRSRSVEIMGLVDRSDLTRHLSEARYYLSTTLIENSSNADAEGATLAAESYLSDIGPHRELFEGVPSRMVEVPGIRRKLFHVMGEDLAFAPVVSWDQVITGMLDRLSGAFHQ